MVSKNEGFHGKPTGSSPTTQHLLTSVSRMAQKKKTTKKTTTKKKPATKKKAVAKKQETVATTTVSAAPAPVAPKVWETPKPFVPQKKKNWFQRVLGF